MPEAMPSRSGIRLGKADAAAFFKAQQDVALQHFGADVFEAHACLHQLQPVMRAHLIHHRGRGQRFDDASFALAIDDEMMEQQANDLVGGQRMAAAVHSANAVGVAVGHETEIVRMLFQIGGASSVIERDGLGIDSAEIRDRALPFRVVTRQVVPREQIIETARAHAE